MAGQFVSRAYVVLLRKSIPQRTTYKLPLCLTLYAMNDLNIYLNLEKLRARFDSVPSEMIEQELKCVLFEPIQIDGIWFKSSAWLDQVRDERLLIFQFQQSGVLINKSYCIGTKYSANGDAVHLTNEQLWEIGIP